jgi:ribonuclease VapC
MADAVLDASAVLAVMNGETGADKVTPLLVGAFVSTVNYAEVTSKLVSGGFNRQTARQAVLALGVRVADFDIDLADRAGELRPLTKHRGLSLGDRACLALAERQNAPVLTTDRSWRDAIPTVEIRVIR